MAIKQRCLFCNEPLPVMKRSDAKYCDARCRQRAYDALRAQPKLLKRAEVLNPPLGFDTDLDYYRWWWSSPVQCQGCLRFTKVQVVMKRSGSPTPVSACDWECLDELFYQLDFVPRGLHLI